MRWPTPSALLLKDDVAPAAQPNQYGGSWQNGQWVPTPATPAASTTAKRFQAISITVDDEQNALTITGPVGKVLAAKDLLEKLDKGEKKRPAPAGPDVGDVHRRQRRRAMGKLALMSKPEFAGSSVVAVAKGTDQVMVYAYMADHVTIKEFLTAPPAAVSSTITKVVPTDRRRRDPDRRRRHHQDERGRRGDGRPEGGRRVGPGHPWDSRADQGGRRPGVRGTGITTNQPGLSVGSKSAP